MCPLPPFRGRSPTPQPPTESQPIPKPTPITSSTAPVTIPGGAVIQNVQEFLHTELAVRKINDIHPHLWWAGRPGAIRALHRQKMMLREIVITESPDLHLVWFDSTIYIKPIPDFLLDWVFFNASICTSSELYALACGFLLSYSKLIVHKSDFRIAQESGLLPKCVDSWESWCFFAADFQNIQLAKVNKRYRYGELRLRRLNQIYQVCRWQLAYHSVYTQYDHYFTQNFGWLLLLFGYLTVILTAMQVILATPGVTKVVQNVSYWFGIASIVVVLGGVVLMLGLFTSLFVYNMVATVRWQRARRLARQQA